MKKHIPTAIKYHCSVASCTVTCRRRYDMKVHMRDQHWQRDETLIEQMTDRCRRSVLENRGFINPGYLEFKGNFAVNSTVSVPSSTAVSSSVSTLTVQSSSSAAVQTSTASTSSSRKRQHDVTPDASIVISTALTSPHDSLPSDSTAFEVVIPTKVSASVTSSSSSNQRISLGDYRLRERSLPATSDVRTVDCSSSFGIRATNDGASQTSSLDYKPLSLPPIPDSQDELEGYILWLCLRID